MILNDTIRNYQFTKSIQKELLKTSREYYALAVLKYSFPSCFSGLHKAESPDLQDTEGFLGVEVTWGGSPRDELISGESNKYSNAKTEKEKGTCLRIIRKNEGDRDEISTSFPVSTADAAKNHIINVFKKKTKKAYEYQKSFMHIGLVIIIDLPVSIISDPKWGSWFYKINKGEFAFVSLLDWSGVNLYDFDADKYYSYRIDRKNMDALKKLGRMTAEGIIGADDPVWVNNE